MLSKKLLKIICCVDCGNNLTQKGNYLHCINCDRKYSFKDRTIEMTPKKLRLPNISKTRWERLYKNESTENYSESYNYYYKHFYKDTLNQINHVKKINRIVYLELGCGKFFFGQSIAKRCDLIIGIDMSSSALRMAETMLKEKGIRNYLLIKGDVLSLPLKNNTIDLIYGGGVIEHFKDTQRAVDENFRVLKKRGVAFNTVPYLNISSLTYRQKWGNIPDVDILKPIFEFLHIKLLRGKHMIFGYELSFSQNRMREIHKRAGYSRILIDKFYVEFFLESRLPLPLKKCAIFLANNSLLFCPMMKVIGYK